MRAMILAAGLGTRLRPLTDLYPKPLLPLANRPQLRHHLELLKAAGVREIMLNVFHLPEAIPRALGDGSSLGLKLHYSVEREILGTGGGVKAVADFLRAPGEPFFLLNGDLLIEIDLRDVLVTHQASGAMATMVLREDPEAASFGVIGVDATDRIVDFVGRARAPGEVVRGGLFTGVHVLEPGVLDLLPEGYSGINETAYPTMVREGMRVQARFQRGFWSDVGTPERYFAANMAMLEARISQPGPSPFEEAAWAIDGPHESGAHEPGPHEPGPHEPGAHEPGRLASARHEYGQRQRVEGWSGAKWSGPVIVGSNVTVGAGAEVGPGVCLGEGARVGAGAVVRRSVVLPGAEIGAGKRIEGALIWRQGEETRVLEVP